MELLRLRDECGQQPEGPEALLVGPSGSHKSESGSTASVMYDYCKSHLMFR